MTNPVVPDAVLGREEDSAAGRSVTGRVLRVLESFTAERPVLSLSEISRRSGMPLTTVHRLVRALTRWGALERGEDGHYRIGLRLWEVASLATRGLPLRDTALPFLEDLYEATHENAQLAVQDGHDVLYVERITGRDAVPVLTRVGARWPMHATGVGLVLLAYADPSLQEAVLAAPLRQYTTQTVVDPRALRTILAEVRRRGYSIATGQITLDAMSVAAPVRGRDDEVVAALSVVVHADGAQPAALAPAVIAAARSLSRVLGAPSATTRRGLCSDEPLLLRPPGEDGAWVPRRGRRS